MWFVYEYVMCIELFFCYIVFIYLFIYLFACLFGSLVNIACLHYLITLFIGLLTYLLIRLFCGFGTYILLFYSFTY